MMRWRYTARFRGETAEITRSYDYSLDSEEEGLKGLENFLNRRRQEFGDKLKWVSLEKWESSSDLDDSAAVWQVVKRLSA